MQEPGVEPSPRNAAGRWRADLVLWLPATVAVLGLGGVAAFTLLGWPGAHGATAWMYCEAFREGGVAQPANTLSNLGFVASGLAIGWRGRRDLLHHEPVGRQNAMARTVFVPALLASVVVFLGPGSMAMHASTTAWGGDVDVLSMFLYVSFLPAYGVSRLLSLSLKGFAVLYGALALLGAADAFAIPDPNDIGFASLAVLGLASEIAVDLCRPELGGERRWLIAGTGLFGLAFAAWLPSQTGGPLCDPHSWIQGHAIWHLLCAATTACFYLHYRCETKPGLPGSV